jgi:hypothetical protein
MRSDRRARGRIVESRFDDRWGAWWSLDLTPAYDGVHRVRRTVVHGLPGVIAVLDEAETTAREEITLRWHTHDAPQVADDGNFLVVNGDVKLAGRIVSLTDESPRLTTGRHEYHAPYDRNRVGEPLEQRNEPYLQATFTADRFRILTLFAIVPAGTQSQTWQATESGWSSEIAGERFTVEMHDGEPSIRRGNEPAWGPGAARP